MDGTKNGCPPQVSDDPEGEVARVAALFDRSDFELALRGPTGAYERTDGRYMLVVTDGAGSAPSSFGPVEVDLTPARGPREGEVLATLKLDLNETDFLWNTSQILRLANLLTRV